MHPWVADLPGWLLAGLGLGGALAALVAVVFAVGTRAFPGRHAAGSAVGGEARRRGEIRAYLRSIDEPFLEDHAIDGRTVAFFLPEHDVAITFDAHDYFHLRRADVHPILVEHELPGAGIGARLPFETPAVERLPVSDRTVAAFDTLGIGPSATTEEVRRAYRERVKEVHPDHGGDAESFRRVREAYTLARERAD